MRRLLKPNVVVQLQREDALEDRIKELEAQVENIGAANSAARNLLPPPPPPPPIGFTQLPPLPPYPLDSAEDHNNQVAYPPGIRHRQPMYSAPEVSAQPSPSNLDSDNAENVSSSSRVSAASVNHQQRLAVACTSGWSGSSALAGQTASSESQHKSPQKRPTIETVASSSHGESRSAMDSGVNGGDDHGHSEAGVDDTPVGCSSASGRPSLGLDSDTPVGVPCEEDIQNFESSQEQECPTD
jgi:hypothetical protein